LLNYFLFTGSAEGHRSNIPLATARCNDAASDKDDDLKYESFKPLTVSNVTSVLTLSTPVSPEVVQPQKLYARRWLIVTLFASYSMSNAYQWIHLNIIYDKLTYFYNESLPASQYSKDIAVDWLSMIYMLSYIPFVLPSAWLLDRKGLRLVAIIATLLNALGAWVKCAAVHPHLFALLMFAQTICAIAQVFILGIPARLAAVWFGPNEVSTATAIGVFGNQV
jgi:MFS family permease